MMWWRGHTPRSIRVGICALALSLPIASVASGRAVAGWWTVHPDVPGRWVLHTPGRSFCALGFSGAPDNTHGTITVMGFCPRAFLKRPRWRLDRDGIVISNRRGGTLATLAIVRNSSLEGAIVDGETISLTR